jgi:hypothetical protein
MSNPTTELVTRLAGRLLPVDAGAKHLEELTEHISTAIGAWMLFNGFLRPDPQDPEGRFRFDEDP